MGAAAGRCANPPQVAQRPTWRRGAPVMSFASNSSKLPPVRCGRRGCRPRPARQIAPSPRRQIGGEVALPAAVAHRGEVPTVGILGVAARLAPGEVIAEPSGGPAHESTQCRGGLGGAALAGPWRVDADEPDAEGAIPGGDGELGGAVDGADGRGTGVAWRAPGLRRRGDQRAAQERCERRDCGSTGHVRRGSRWCGSTARRWCGCARSAGPGWSMPRSLGRSRRAGCGRRWGPGR